MVDRLSTWEACGAQGKVFTPNESIATTATNQMDCWLIASLQTLIKTVHVEIGENYKLYNVAPPLVQYLEQITNWYLRLNRDRLKGDSGEKDWHDALSTTYTVLLNMCIGARTHPSRDIVWGSSVLNSARGRCSNGASHAVHRRPHVPGAHPFPPAPTTFPCTLDLDDRIV